MISSLMSSLEFLTSSSVIKKYGEVRPVPLSRTLSPAVIQPNQAHPRRSRHAEVMCEVAQKHHCDVC